MLLKTGVQSELTLGDIASLMVRNDVDLDIPSELEVAVSRASALAESMVRSPRMRGYSYNSTSPTPPHSPTKKYGTPSPSGKLIRSSSPVSRKYSKRRRSNVAVIIVRVIFISLFLFYCLLLNHSFPTNPNRITNCFKPFSLLQLYNFTTTLLLRRYFDF